MKILVIFLLSTLSSIAFAEYAYVTDQFKVTVRSGESSQHRINNMIPTGTKVKVLNRNSETGYTKVTYSNGRRGYILSRQLIDDPVAREQLSKLEAEVAVLKTAPSELQTKLSALTKQYHALEKADNELQEIKDTIQKELASLKHTSSDAVRISNERNDLRKQVASLLRTTEEAKQEKIELENNSAQRWFIIGAAVILGGILIGLILPHLRIRKRKDNWGSL